MKIKLRHMIIDEPLNVENPAFNATLYINDIKVGNVRNGDYPGETTFKSTTGTEKERQLVKEAEEFFKDVSPLIKEGSDHKLTTVPMTLGAYIDSLWRTELAQMRMRSLIKEGVNLHTSRIHYGIPYKHYEFLEYKIPLKKLLKSPEALDLVRKDLETKILPLYDDGYRIIKTNIPQEVLQKLGASSKHFSDIWGGIAKKNDFMKIKGKKSKGLRL